MPTSNTMPNGVVTTRAGLAKIKQACGSLLPRTPSVLVGRSLTTELLERRKMQTVCKQAGKLVTFSRGARVTFAALPLRCWGSSTPSFTRLAPRYLEGKTLPLSTSARSTQQSIRASAPTAAAQSEPSATGDIRILFFDLETTGLRPAVDRIIDVAVYDPVTDKYFESLVNPERPIPPQIANLTGITSEMVDSCKTFSQVVAELQEFCGGGPVCLVGHNAQRFDTPFLSHEFTRAGAALPDHWLFLDTLKLSRDFKWKAHPAGPPPRHALGKLWQHLGLEQQTGQKPRAHRAAADAWMCARVYESMVGGFKGEHFRNELWSSQKGFLDHCFSMGTADTALPAAGAEQKGPKKEWRIADCDTSNLPAMMKQYAQECAKYPQALVMMQCGDFFECFFEHAIQLADQTDCVVSMVKRAGNKEGKVPMAGVPIRSIDGYTKLLTEKGVKIVLLEQLESKAAQQERDKGGLIKRGVTRILTPGTITEEDLLDARANNFLVSVIVNESEWGLAYADVSTGDFKVTMGRGMELLHEELVRISPSEVLYPAPSAALSGFTVAPGASSADLPPQLPRELQYTFWNRSHYSLPSATQALMSYFNLTMSMQALGCEDEPLSIRAAGALLAYVISSHAGEAPPLGRLCTYAATGHLRLDATARRNLEVMESLRKGRAREGSLLSALDNPLTGCRTRMGSRRMRVWLMEPLTDPRAIGVRLAAVGALVEDHLLRSQLRGELPTVGDLERLTGHLSRSPPAPRHLVSLKESLTQLPAITALLRGSKLKVASKTVKALEHIAHRLHPVPPQLLQLSQALEDAFGQDPNLFAANAGLSAQDAIAKWANGMASSDAGEDEGGAAEGLLFMPGASKELDDALHRLQQEKAAILAYREREAKAVPGLKLGYTRLSNFYLALLQSKLKTAKIPPDYSRETGTKSEARYSTKELKQLFASLLSAQEAVIDCENRLLKKLGTEAAAAIDSIRSAAHALAELDVLSSLASTAVNEGYNEPEIVAAPAARDLVIDLGRHPVVERTLDPADTYVPNSISFGGARARALPGSDDASSGQAAEADNAYGEVRGEDTDLIVLTGPNASGKSCYMRQVALIQLMAQMGSFVPAERAVLSICDRIFTRVGAVDDVAAGKSTFTVEMAETAEILAHATEHSLVLLDEVGRGTATSDGVAIATAIAEHLAGHIRARTIFATHYHELNTLQARLPNVANFQVTVSRVEGRLVFEHRVERGAAMRSFGIEVAKLVGIPACVTARAEALEREAAPALPPPPPTEPPAPPSPAPAPLVNRFTVGESRPTTVHVEDVSGEGGGSVKLKEELGTEMGGVRSMELSRQQWQDLGRCAHEVSASVARMGTGQPPEVVFAGRGMRVSVGFWAQKGWVVVSLRLVDPEGNNTSDGVFLDVETWMELEERLA